MPELTKEEGFQRTIAGSVSQTLIEEQVHTALTERAKTFQRAGFRPGRVPMHLIKQSIGDPLQRQIRADLLEADLRDAMETLKMVPATRPNIKVVSDDAEALKWEAEFEVMPEVSCPDVDALAVSKPTAEISDELVEQELRMVRQASASWEPVDSDIQPKGALRADIEATKDGEPVAGMSGTDLVVDLSKPLPDALAEALRSAKVGAQVNVTATMPDEWPSDPDLAGQDVTFDLKVKTAVELKSPEDNDEFYAKSQLGTTRDEFAKRVRDNLSMRLDRALEQQFRTNVFDAFAAIAPTELPERRLQEEEMQVMHEVTQRGAKIEDLMKDDESKSWIQQRARHRFSVTLVMKAIMDEHEIQPSPAVMSQLIEERVSQEQDSKKRRQLAEQIMQDSDAMGSVRAMALEQEIVEFVMKKANITEVPEDARTILKMPADPEASETSSS